MSGSTVVGTSSLQFRMQASGPGSHIHTWYMSSRHTSPPHHNDASARRYSVKYVAVPGRRLMEQMHRSMCAGDLHVQLDNTIAGTRQELDSTIAGLRKSLEEEVTSTFDLVWFDCVGFGGVRLGLA